MSLSWQILLSTLHQSRRLSFETRALKHESAIVSTFVVVSDTDPRGADTVRFTASTFYKLALMGT